MDLIYYYPAENGAPSSVAKKLFKELLKSSDLLPFDKIKLCCKKEYATILKNEFKGTEILTYQKLNSISEQDLVHIPVLPTILPNIKFLLYSFVFVKKSKLILQYHGDVRTELKSSYKDIKSTIHILTYIFTPKLLRSADKVIVHSYFMERIVNNYGIKNDIVIPIAIDDYWLQPSKKIYISEIIDNETFNVFFHGRLSWEKGIDILLEAASNFVKKDSKIIIYIAGDGPQKKYLEKLCLNLKIHKNVVFLGEIDRECIKFYLNKVDVAIYPSRFDAFCLAALEALACANCPVYFSKNIGMYDFVIREGSRLNYFEPTVKDLDSILTFVSKNIDKKIINEQRSYAERHRWDQILHRYIELYKEVLN